MWYFLLFAALLGADQLIKYWTVEHLALGESAAFWPGVMRLTRVHNYGAAWSSFSGMRWLLIVFTSLMMVVCLIYLIREYRKSKLLTASLTLIIGGGIGNLIDRIFRDGLVVD